MLRSTSAALPSLALTLVLALATAGCATTVRRPSAGPVADDKEQQQRRPAPLPALGAPLDHSQLDRYSTRTIPGGLACLIQLKNLGIPHAHLRRLRGVDTPVRITGPIGGVRFLALGRLPLACDCRLALALRRAAPYLSNLGVTELHFSNAYSYRMMPSGRPSRHAMGLAIDVHGIKVGDEMLKLEEDYALDLPDSGCTGDSPALNRIGCLLRDKGLFDRVLTPDFDRAQHNHFHLAILSLHRRRRPPRDGQLQADAD
jgi:hypothetical protein